MPDSKKINPEKSIEFRIFEVKRISSFQNDVAQLGLSRTDIKHGTVKLNVSHKVDHTKNLVSILLNVIFKSKKIDREIDLFGIESVHSFQIKGISKLLSADKTKINIPDNLMLAFLNISISGTRGMLAILNANPDYASIILPLIDPKALLKEIKEMQE